MTLHKRYRQNTDVVTRHEGDETFLFNADTAAFVVINETARVIWEQCATITDIASITAAMAAQYEVDEETAHKDIMEHIGELTKKSFLVEVTA